MTPKVPFDRPVPLCSNAPESAVAADPVCRIAPATDHNDRDKVHHRQSQHLQPAENQNQKTRRRNMEIAEYRKLKAVVPSIRHLRRAKKLTIINEAVKYIDKLQADLIKRTALRDGMDRKSVFMYVEAMQRSLSKLD